MKKFFVLFVLAAFVGVVASPALVLTEKNSPVVVLDQSFDKDLDKDKDKDKKKAKATKAEAKSKEAANCGGCAGTTGCGEKATETKSSSCCGEKTEGKKTI